MSNYRNGSSNDGMAYIMAALLVLVLIFVVTEFIVFGVIAWKWGQKQTWTIYDRFNGFIAAIIAIALSIVGTTIIGGGFPFVSPYWFENYFLSGLWVVNILLICIGAVILLIWFIQWLFTPSGQEKPQSPKEWIINYLRN